MFYIHTARVETELWKRREAKWPTAGADNIHATGSAKEMATPFRQSSFWLNEKGEASKDASNSYQRAPPMLEQSSHLPSTGLDEYLDDEGKDRRIGVASSSGSDDDEGDSLPKQWFSWRKLWLFTGPGFLMSIAYLVRLLFLQSNLLIWSQLRLRYGIF